MHRCLTAYAHQISKATMEYPLKHISIRVPWHDSGWNGNVCKAPRLNGACLKLSRIAANRNDNAEESVAGNSIQNLSQSNWPSCIIERAAFMAPFEYVRETDHPYNRGPETEHGHFKRTRQRHPPYSAPVVPFAWVLRDAMGKLGKEHNLDVQAELETDLDFKTKWVQSHLNQTELLDCFAKHLKPERSLCFFYAKQTPFVEDALGGRILIGVGRVRHIGTLQEYDYTTTDLEGKLRSVLWERMIQHSIRPDFKDGFLLPYHAAIEKAAKDPEFDPAEIAAFSPSDRLLEFSHASELVSNDGAIASLLACAESLRKANGVLRGPWDRCLRWIDKRLGELWKARGPCPSLGSALNAFGLEYGTLVAHILADKAGDNVDPWPLVEKMFADPRKHLPEQFARSIGETLSRKWSLLPDDRRALLKLVSRFEVAAEQATVLYVPEVRSTAGIEVCDADLLANPYLFYELTRLTADPVSLRTVDQGVFPDRIIREKHPLSAPTNLDSGTDARRVRAFAVKVLEDAAIDGNTLLPQDQVVQDIRALPLQPPCPVDTDLLNVVKDNFEAVVEDFAMANGDPALQLNRLRMAGKTIHDATEKRITGRRMIVEDDWRSRLDEHPAVLSFEGPDELKKRGRTEQEAALKELAAARLSVLIGPAGTGKTTLVSILCSHPELKADGILLLAPTGKARVRMEQSAQDLGLKGYTIAQFLNPHRYDGATGRYQLSPNKPKDTNARTVIVDEASMLTEEMLAALIQALKGVHRLILIGDPRQLPPIGAGRPFVDIVKRLAPEDITERFPRIGLGYAELTVRYRQAGKDREDLRLAEWFSGAPIAAGEDDVFDKLQGSDDHQHLRLVQWKTADELRSHLIEVLVSELKLFDETDIAGFDATLGGEAGKKLRFFNPRRNGKAGAAEAAESWQILSPVRSAAHGVSDLNRFIHKRFRQPMINAARQDRLKIPKPMGLEEIVYGDKVINLINTDPKLSRNKHRRVYPEKVDPYIANGEIGMTVGYFQGHGKPDFRWKLQVEFSSQPGFRYDFLDRDFSEEGNAVLELAYALTVHKSQGSQFGTVILVLPNPCHLMSRELLYTALTRQKDRIIILYQGDYAELRKYSSDVYSETARRLTNLFNAPSPIETNGRFFEDRLIHRTSRGEMVRSKSEVIIADLLASHYERPLKIEGVTKFPDFTIEDMDLGLTFYWEHCGMLHVPDYRRRWEEKLGWYKSHDILPLEDGTGENGTLIFTRDDDNGSIDSERINTIISKMLR